MKQVHAQFYSEAGFQVDCVCIAFELVSKYLKIPKERLRPNDRLHEDLARQSIITPKLDNLSDAVLQLSPSTINEEDLLTIETVDDLVHLIAENVDLNQKFKG